MQVPLYRHNLTNSFTEHIMTKMTNLLKGMSISSGPIGENIQSIISIELGVKNCFLTSSWTTGAMAALISFGFKPNSEVIIPACTFIATASAIKHSGLIPRVVDIDPNTKLIDIDKVLSAINNNTVAVMPVHLYGQMVDVKKLRSLLPSRIKIIEDSAHGIECSIDGYRPGNHSDAAVFSFYASKTLTTGEGGAVVIDDPDLAKRFITAFRHGMPLSGWQRHHSDKYIHAVPEMMGIKANMPDILALLLESQLYKMRETLKQRQEIALRYDLELPADKFQRPLISNQITTHSRHMYAIGVESSVRDRLLDYLVENGVKTAVHYLSLSEIPVMAEYIKNDCSVAEEWGESTLTIPCFAGMTENEQDHVIKVLKDFR